MDKEGKLCPRIDEVVETIVDINWIFETVSVFNLPFIENYRKSCK